MLLARAAKHQEAVPQLDKQSRSLAAIKLSNNQSAQPFSICMVQCSLPFSGLQMSHTSAPFHASDGVAMATCFIRADSWVATLWKAPEPQKACKCTQSYGRCVGQLCCRLVTKASSSSGHTHTHTGHQTAPHLAQKAHSPYPLPVSQSPALRAYDGLLMLGMATVVVTRSMGIIRTISATAQSLSRSCHTSKHSDSHLLAQHAQSGPRGARSPPP